MTIKKLDKLLKVSGSQKKKQKTVKQAPAQDHKKAFEQLLDDAVIGVKKKL